MPMIVRGETRHPVLGRLLVGSRSTASAEPKELLACFTPDTLGHIKLFRGILVGNSLRLTKSVQDCSEL